MVIPVGGDGTFLLAASMVTDNQKPVVGFNSDPNRSEGYLCLPKKYSTNIRNAIERLNSVSIIKLDLTVVFLTSVTNGSSASSIRDILLIVMGKLPLNYWSNSNTVFLAV